MFWEAESIVKFSKTKVEFGCVEVILKTDSVEEDETLPEMMTFLCGRLIVSIESKTMSSKVKTTWTSSERTSESICSKRFSSDVDERVYVIPFVSVWPTAS